MLSAPVLRLPNYAEEFYLSTDASQYAIGPVLEQEDENGDRHPVAYLSRQLKGPEEYYTTERECLAIVWSIQQCRCYLYGRRFTMITDHKPLIWLYNVKEPTGRLSMVNAFK